MQDRWDKVLEELEARRRSADASRLSAEEASRLRKGPVIETSHRLVERTAPPAPDKAAAEPKRFAENGSLLDSAESFLSVGKKGKW